jgi:hypothetical protein
MSLNLSEEENDRLVREALAQFYLPTTRLLSQIEDTPTEKRQKLDLNLDVHQTTELSYQNSSNLGNKYSCNNNNNLNVCGQASLLDTSNLFHSFTVTSLET